MNNISLPSELNYIIDNEPIEFSVISTKHIPPHRAYPIFSISIILAIAPILTFIILKSVAPSSEDQVLNSVPLFLLSIPFLGGILMAIFGFYVKNQKGGYFIGTQSRLIHYLGGVTKSYHWSEFSGLIETNISQGDIYLHLKVGKTYVGKFNQRHFMPYTLYLLGLPDEVLAIEKICGERIQASR